MKRFRLTPSVLLLAVASVGACGLCDARAAAASRNRAVIIGVNGYYRVGKLRYCVADAEAVRAQLVRGGVFQPGDVILMTDDATEPQNRPTYLNIESRLEGLHNFAKGADTVLVFFAGHGEMTGEGNQRCGLLVPIDGTPTKGIELPKVRAWLARCKAKNTLLILDCCHAGQGERGVRAIAPSLAAGAGILVMASCQADQKSHEVPDQGHGLFSLYLANGLAGKADQNRDRQVTAAELFAYVRAGVSGFAYRKDWKQTPVLLPENAAGSVLLSRVRKATDPLPAVPALPALPDGQRTLDEWVKKLDECEKALADTKKYYRPTSGRVQAAAANVRKAREGTRQALLGELAPRLKALRERYKTMGRDMRPNHPKMVELAGEIGAHQTQAMKIGVRVLPILTEAEQEAVGLGSTITLDLGNGVKLELVRIPAGEFQMGSSESDSAKPVHKVRITKPFYMGKTEVTQEQWQAVMGNNPSRFKGAKNPVEQVSWDDCQAFVKKLSAKVGGLAFALPTEAEWEYACRAGSTTKYCFGDSDRELGDYGWYDSNSDKKTHPVGQKKPNAFGLYDMHGNVWEWCQDWYDENYYKNSPKDDPTGPTKGDGRVLRGGSWFYDPWSCRSAYRFRGNPTYRNDRNGCRVVSRDFQ
jgi:formylglycine-generating enzyme required for sulfatase activity